MDRFSEYCQWRISEEIGYVSMIDGGFYLNLPHYNAKFECSKLPLQIICSMRNLAKHDNTRMIYHKKFHKNNLLNSVQYEVENTVQNV